LLVKIDAPWNENNIDELDGKGRVISMVVRLATFPIQPPVTNSLGMRIDPEIGSLDRRPKPGFKYSVIRESSPMLRGRQQCSSHRLPKIGLSTGAAFYGLEQRWLRSGRPYYMESRPKRSLDLRRQ
jgi:hypothetical protein